LAGKKKIDCVYCTTLNPAEARHCSACGAPLDVSRIEIVEKPASRENLAPSSTPASVDVVQLGKKVEEGSLKAFTVYSAFWRALADAAVIGMVTFGIGVIGGVVGQGFVSVVLSAVFGLVIGFTRKSYLFTIISGPLGFIAGSLLGGVLWAVGLGAVPMLYCTSLGAAAAALLGSRRMPFRFRNFWDRFRPVLGIAGGAGFGILGTGVGIGLRTAAAALGLL